MAVKLRRTLTGYESPEAFVEELRPIWHNVAILSVSRMRKGEPEHLGDFEVIHVEGTPDTPDKDVKTVARWLEDHAEKLGQATRYLVVARGTQPPPKPAKGKPASEPIYDAELAEWATKIGPEAPSEDKDPWLGIANIMKGIPDLYSGSMTAADHSLRLLSAHNGMLLQQVKGLQDEIVILRGESHRNDEWKFRMRVEEIGAEERHRAAEMDARRAEAEARQRSEFIQVLNGGLTMVLQARIADKRAADQKREREEKKRAAADPGFAESDDTEASDADESTSVRDGLAQLLADLPPEQQAKLDEAMGKRSAGPGTMWELFVAASKAKNDREAKAVLECIVSEMQEDSGKVAAGITAVLGILGPVKGQRLMGVLREAGILPSL